MRLNTQFLFIMVSLILLMSSGQLMAYGIQGEPTAIKSGKATSQYRDAQDNQMHFLYAQDQRKRLRSRDAVVREVKETFNAKVLKVSLDKRNLVYNVRVLMPNGRVRRLQIDAQR